MRLLPPVNCHYHDIQVSHDNLIEYGHWYVSLLAFIVIPSSKHNKSPKHFSNIPGWLKQNKIYIILTLRVLPGGGHYIQ